MTITTLPSSRELKQFLFSVCLIFSIKKLIVYENVNQKDVGVGKKMDFDVIVIGSGMAGLTTASLLAKEGKKVGVLEQNWLPGGCSSSYPRKNYVFESGATTLVGLDEQMPLKYLLETLGIELNARKLTIPMKVHLTSGKILTRYQNLEKWIAEAERVFGPNGQRPFWETCYKISQFVWQTSLQQRAFPPSSIKDLVFAVKNFRPQQLAFGVRAFQSMKSLLEKYGLNENEEFVAFVNEQLLITAQNYLEEVNVLFGAAALCYTNYGNYYIDGGLINLVNPLVEYIQSTGGVVHLRTPVVKAILVNGHYEVITQYRKKKKRFTARKVVSAIPINNTLELFDDEKILKKYQKKIMGSEDLNSAFSLGFVAKKRRKFDCIHHQIHLQEPLPYSGSHSIFLSLSHPKDTTRCGPYEIIGSVSTHIPHPGKTFIANKEEIADAIFNALEQAGLVAKEDITFQHASTPYAWEKWTKRQWGFVGGYPQYMRIKPWEMIDARLDHKGAYICGDSTYPGQGIPGACLSGIIAWQKMRLDANWLIL